MAYYDYSSHKSEAAAWEYLAQLVNADQISESEYYEAKVEKRYGGKVVVMLRAMY